MISAIKILRQRTGLSIGECRKFLNQTNQDISAAAELIVKETGRKLKDVQDSAEFLAVVIPHQEDLLFAEVGAKTDFVLLNQDFQKYLAQLGPRLLEGPDLSEVSGKFGEPIWIREVSRAPVRNTEVYLHNKLSSFEDIRLSRSVSAIHYSCPNFGLAQPVARKLCHQVFAQNLQEDLGEASFLGDELEGKSPRLVRDVLDSLDIQLHKIILMGKRI